VSALLLLLLLPPASLPKQHESEAAHAENRWRPRRCDMSSWNMRLKASRRHSLMPTSPSQEMPDARPTTETGSRVQRPATADLESAKEETAQSLLAVPGAQLQQAGRQNRFSLLRFRHASDSQLNRTAKEQAMATPPLPSTLLAGSPLNNH